MLNGNAQSLLLGNSFNRMPPTAKQLGTKADLVTLWTGANDLVNGDDPKQFQQELRGRFGIVKEDISQTIVVANLPDLTMLPPFRTSPSPSVTPGTQRGLHSR